MPARSQDEASPLTAEQVERAWRELGHADALWISSMPQNAVAIVIGMDQQRARPLALADVK